MTQLTQKLGKFWWSPKPPEEYVTNVTRPLKIQIRDQVLDAEFIGKFGIGKCAHLNYAAFNITYVFYSDMGEYTTYQQQEEAIVFFDKARLFLDSHRETHDFLEFHLTARTQDEFSEWYYENRATFTTEAKALLDLMVHKNAQKLPGI